MRWVAMCASLLVFACTSLDSNSEEDSDASEHMPRDADADRADASPKPDAAVHDAGVKKDAATSDAGETTPPADAATTGDGSVTTPDDDGGAEPDATAPFCTSADDGCNGDMLEICNEDGSAFTQTACAVGCSTSPSPHCTELYPSGPVASGDLVADELSEITVPSGVTLLNTDTGALSGGVTRAANTVNTKREINAGIAFHQTADGSGVFSFAKLTVASGATLKLIGANAAALVAADTLTVYGVIDARPMDGSGALCPAARVAGPGGALGGAGGSVACCPSYNSGQKGDGLGGGGLGTRAMQGDPAGGGGAGHAAAGGNGAGGCHQGVLELAGGSGGMMYSGLTGGSGGGGGGAAAGGGGGGAVRLVAGLVITIADGSMPAGVNAGGCGGKGGVGAGGGGSGGTITLEAPFVQLAAKGTLAANGGSGGANPSSTATDGQPGQLSAAPALLPGNTVASAGEGNGGAGDAPAGRAIVNVVCSANDGTGGGGAAGIIEILSANPNINAQAILSPSVASGAAHTGAADVH